MILSAKSISTKKNTLFSSAILFTIQNNNKISILGSIIQKLWFKKSENRNICYKFLTLFTCNTFGMLYLSMPNNSSFQLLIIIVWVKIILTDMLNYDPPFPNGNLLLSCFNFSSLSSALAAIFCNSSLSSFNFCLNRRVSRGGEGALPPPP